MDILAIFSDTTITMWEACQESKEQHAQDHWGLHGAKVNNTAFCVSSLYHGCRNITTHHEQAQNVELVNRNFYSPHNSLRSVSTEGRIENLRKYWR